MKLSLDHISVTDTTPAKLVELAAATGCSGICPFLHSMAVLPAMPPYDLSRDRTALRETRSTLRANDVIVNLVYPFTLTGRTIVADFARLLDAGAELGAPLANVLCYDRDPSRRSDKLVELAELAGSFGIELVIEFYPPSQIRTLAEALEEIARSGRNDVGVTLDLLHVMRGGAAVDSIALFQDEHIRIAQIADGPWTLAADKMEWEAGYQRLLPGEGAFDIRSLVHALNPAVPLSVEVPQQTMIEAGVPVLDRARAAVDATRTCLEPRHPR
jgi:sugar phosphate isomerase/epimerase